MIESCYVRIMTMDDLPIVLAWRNNPKLRKHMLTQHQISMQEHRSWFERVQHDKTRQQLIVMERAVPLGFVQFNSIGQGSIADWGFYLRPDAPKGSGRKLGQTALLHGFRSLGLHKICGQALQANVVSIAFHQKLGFIEEGRLREQQLINGNYHTLICFGLLAKDWVADLRSQVKTDATN
jgi:UDP-4-amino-4,6-dideoxy-N-acetyl-beta-L-altrosamine N-acetyltransferase